MMQPNAAGDGKELAGAAGAMGCMATPLENLFIRLLMLDRIKNLVKWNWSGETGKTRKAAMKNGLACRNRAQTILLMLIRL